VAVCPTIPAAGVQPVSLGLRVDDGVFSTRPVARWSTVDQVADTLLDTARAVAAGCPGLRRRHETRRRRSCHEPFIVGKSRPLAARQTHPVDPGRPRPAESTRTARNATPDTHRMLKNPIGSAANRDGTASSYHPASARPISVASWVRSHAKTSHSSPSTTGVRSYPTTRTAGAIRWRDACSHSPAMSDTKRRTGGT
jgi:hypothetical protein